METRFVTNLNARAIAQENDNSPASNSLLKNTEIQSNMEPWDAHLAEMKVNPNADYIGKTLLELGWREKFGINIVYIKRGEKVIHVPGRDISLMPFDQVGIIATDAQVQSFKPIFESIENIVSENANADDIVLKKVIVDEHTKLHGVDIRSSGLRERTNGLIVGIERNKDRILNPDSTVKLEWGDVLWIVGDKKKIQELYKED